MAHDALRRRILTWLAVLPVSGKLIAKESIVNIRQHTGDRVASPELALSAVRFFNTMEGWHKFKFKTYLSKPELLEWDLSRKALGQQVKGGAAQNKGLASLMTGDADELLPGWRFQLHASPGRDDYLVVMRSEEMMIASGDPGIIYYGDVPPETESPKSYAPVRDMVPFGLTPLGASGAIERTARGRASNIVRRVAFMTMGSSPVQTHCGCNCWGSVNGFCWNVGSTSCTWCCCGQKDDCCYDAAVNGGVTGGCRCTDCGCSALLE